MTILAIDTALASLRLALLGEGVSLAHSRDMAKGQAEALFPTMDALLHEAGIRTANLSAIAVNVGPGSFTGTRVGVAAAKGLAMALDVPLYGITTLEAFSLQAEGVPAAVIMDARRDEVYLQLFDDGAPTSEAIVVRVEDLTSASFAGRMLLGSGAALVPEHPSSLIKASPFPDPLAIARLAAQGVGRDRTTPFYLRSADAKPQLDKVLERLGSGGAAND